MYFEFRKWLDIKGRRIFARPISIVDWKESSNLTDRRKREKEREREREEEDNDSNKELICCLHTRYIEWINF